MRRRKTLLGLAGAVVAVPIVAWPGSAAPPTAAPDPGARVTDVRLLTGDVVTLGGESEAQVRPAQGREHVTFYTSRDDQGDTHVVPEDAVVPLAQGRLDPALFDVSALARAGYRDTLPLIVDYAGATPRSAAARVTRELPVLSAAAVDAELAGGYWATVREAEHVWLDASTRLPLNRSVAQVDAPAAPVDGHTGAGATVAVLDTGIDTTHPDLADAVVATKILSDSTTIDDLDGFGTHIASIITGDSAKYPGVAPDAKLLIGKVVDDDGWTRTSSVIAGMEWAAASGADVVNISLGSPRPSDGTDPVSMALNEITAKTGVLFVAAAGETGLDTWVASPAAADAALAVGAVDSHDALAFFSGRGPRLGDGAMKPDITAPGVSVVGAKAVNGTGGGPGGPVEDGYVAMSGTAVAAPRVAGAAAILAAEHPDWTPDQLKAALMGTAEPNSDLTVFEQGAGQLDIAAATRTPVVASVGSLNFGRSAWPHEDDEPVTQTITYTNPGTEAVVLDLTADVQSGRGVEAPAGMFTFAPAQLTVPAGGQASTTVTADTRVKAVDGMYTGAIVAGNAVRTPLVLHREAQTHTVTVNMIGYDGNPTDLFATRFTNVDPEPYAERSYRGYDPSGTVTLRLPDGEYFVTGTVQERLGDQGDYRNAEFAEPAFTVTGDTTLTFDAREAKPVELRTDKPNAKPGKGWVLFVRDTPGGQVGVKMSGRYQTFENMTVRPSTTSSDNFQFVAEAHLAEWNGTSFDNSPYLYHLRHTERGAVPKTLRWHERDRDLAKVRTEHARTRTGTVGRRDYFLYLSLPRTLTEYYTPDKQWAYEQEFVEVLENDRFTSVASSRQVVPMVFTTGRTTTMRWGFGVHGPAMPASAYYSAEQTGVRDPIDRLRFGVPMYTDQTPGRVGYTYAGSTQLLRDGKVIGESDEPGGGVFNLGPGRAEYTLRTTVEPPEAGLSTHIDAEWTFTSAHDDNYVAIPLLALRFAPNLDNDNAAPAGKRFTIPLYAQRNGDTAPATVNAPTVEVSYDDGKTWHPTTVTTHHDQWKATVNHPRDAKFVSLRSHVTDQDGNSQRQTIIRAYALK